MNARKLILDEYRRQRGVPFAWGSADCLCFAAACAAAMIGRDPIVHLRGRYDSEIGARRVMVAVGWRDMGDVVASLFPEIPPAQARSGDWAWIVNADGSDGIGVVCGAMCACKTRDGTGQVPLAHARRAFRVQ